MKDLDSVELGRESDAEFLGIPYEGVFPKDKPEYRWSTFKKYRRCSGSLSFNDSGDFFRLLKISRGGIQMIQPFHDICEKLFFK